MSGEPIVNRVKSSSVGLPGRTLNTARTNHFVIDSPKLGEAVTSGEAFLSGISSCGVTLIEIHAREKGIPLAGLDVTIEGVRAADRPMDFQSVGMRFEMRGVSQEQAEQLVSVYQAN